MPAPTIYDTFQAVSAAWEVNERLIHHSKAGGMLAGLKFDHAGTLKVDGYDDLPLCQPWSININEGLSAGAPSSGTNQKERRNQPASETLTLSFRVAVSRKDGWFRRDPTNRTQSKGFMEWLALIRDAIETSTDAEPIVDAALTNSSFKPVRFSVKETETTQLAFSCFLEVEILVHSYCRAQRVYTLPQI